MKVTTQFALFVVFGGIQIAIDTLLFAAIFLVVGDPLVGNVVSRGTAAVAGFLLNRRFTFHAQGKGGVARQALRYTLLWLALTVLSTALIGTADSLLAAASRQREWIIGVKLVIEAVLALLSFLGMRYGIFPKGEP